MCLLKTVIAKHKGKKARTNNVCDNLIMRINIALQGMNNLFAHDHLIEATDENRCQEYNNRLIADIDSKNIQKLKKASNFSVLSSKLPELYNDANNFKEKVRQHNNRVIDTKIQNAYKLIGTIEGKNLDKQQLILMI